MPGPWTAHPTVKSALQAPLPPNISKGTFLRQFWVNGVRAQRPVLYGHGRQQGDNRDGFCLNLSLTSPTPMYSLGSAFDFAHENATDPTTWSNPSDVEFVYTSCDAINCWIEPRCTVESVAGSVVRLKQDGNGSCFHRLSYYPQCFNNGQGGMWNRGHFPTHLENVETNWTQPGQFYYDRAAGRIGYIPRAGETAATLVATAKTATVQTLLQLSNATNHVFHGIEFQYGTWLGASDNVGYVDTQSAYLCQYGEPPVNVHAHSATNITFSNCGFRHLGAVYAVGADGGSQGIAVSNCTFDDISGGGVKLGSAGERGAPPPSKTLDPALQDRGFLVSDSLFTGIPIEYSGANPIFAAYVADTAIVHNTIDNSRYSGVCVGWGWGLESYCRNIVVVNNSITRPMQLLADGGGVYTNVVCPNCHVSRNYFTSDPHVYGCLYHDGGSALWTDADNVFNHIGTSAVFAHGNCPGISVNPVFYNDSSPPSLEGATNNGLRDADGVCVAATIVKLEDGQRWTGTAADVVINAGRREGSLPPPIPPKLSPPVNDSANNLQLRACVRFAARLCNASKPSQRWILSAGVTPGDGRPTSVRSAVPRNASCWQANNCGYGSSLSCDVDRNTNGAHGGSPIPGSTDGCKALPNATSNLTDHCAHNQAFVFNPNGTIALAMQSTDRGQYMHHCVQVVDTATGGGSDPDPVLQVGLSDCVISATIAEPSQPSQTWNVTKNDDGTISISQGSLCIDNNYRPYTD